MTDINYEQKGSKPIPSDIIKKINNNNPLPGQQDKGKPDRLGEVPPKYEGLISGKSGGVLEPGKNLGV